MEKVEKRKRKLPYMDIFYFFFRRFPFSYFPFRRFPSIPVPHIQEIGDAGDAKVDAEIRLHEEMRDMAHLLIRRCFFRHFSLGDAASP